MNKKTYSIPRFFLVIIMVLCVINIIHSIGIINQQQQEIEALTTRLDEQAKAYEKYNSDLEEQVSDLRDMLEDAVLIERVKYEGDKDFLAKLLYCEAGGTSWKTQVYTCSAILNLSDYTGESVWELGHDSQNFSVAPYVDKATPTSTQYEVIEYVLNGGKIPDICFFRSDGGYHNFGTPVCQVGGHYFSKPVSI